jgi:hypothetical protein
VLSVQESADAKERGSIAGGVDLEPEGSIDEAVVGPVDGHLSTILRGSLRVHLTMMPRVAGRNATTLPACDRFGITILSYGHSNTLGSRRP